MSSLYRKYRPKTFAEMVGQKHIKLTLQNELETDSFVHAYLFCGPRGLGKTTAARLFAKAVNCENRKKGQSEPCNQCRSCVDLNEARAIDVIEIDAASYTGVDNVRENIIENIRFSPSKAKFKVFIVDEVHMLSISAFNALLKTLEEPPAYVIFILCTTEIHKVPETIISRCQRFDFRKIAASEAIKRLKKIADKEKVKIDNDIFEIIAAKSDGCMRDAEKLLGQILSVGSKKITKEQVALILPMSEVGLIIDFINLLIARRTGEALEFVNNLVEEGVDLEVFDRQVIEFLRKLVLIKSGAAKNELMGMTKEVHKQAEQILELVKVGRLAEIITILLNSLRELKNSEIVQLPMELAVIKICGQDDENIMDSVSSIKTARIMNPRPQAAKRGGQESQIKDSQKDLKEIKDIKDIKKNNSNTTNINLGKIKANWLKIITESHKKNMDLMFINEKMVWPVEVAGEDLLLGFKYDLHKSRFDKNGHGQTLAEVIKQMAGEKVNIKTKTLKPSELVELEIEEENKTTASEKMSGVKVTEENILDAVLENFGGEIVEQNIEND